MSLTAEPADREFTERIHELTTQCYTAETRGLDTMTRIRTHLRAVDAIMDEATHHKVEALQATGAALYLSQERLGKAISVSADAHKPAHKKTTTLGLMLAAVLSLSMGPVRSTEGKPMSFLDQATSAMRSRDYATARAKFREALEKDKADAELCLGRIADCYIEDRQPQQALDTLKELDARGGITATAAYIRGLAFDQLGNRESGRFWLDTAAMRGHPLAALELSQRK